MINVLHVIRNINDGGTEKFLINLLNSIDKNKYKNYIVVYDKNISSDLNNENIIFIDDPKKSGLLRNINNLKKIMKKYNINIVHSYTHYNSGYVMLAAFLCGIKKRITHSHRSESTAKKTLIVRIYNFISKLLINIFCNKKISCGINASKDLFFFYRKVKIINNGIDVNKFTFNRKIRTEIRKKYSFDENDKIIGIVARLDENKNQIFMLKLLKKMPNNYKLLLIGDGEKRNFLEEFVKKQKLESRVVFTGSINNVNEYYNAMDVFCLTSFKEGLPYVLIEAQYNGLGCVVSNSVDKNSDISNNISFISLQESSDIWEKTISFKASNRKYDLSNIINQNFSLQNTVSQIEKIYEN